MAVRDVVQAAAGVGGDKLYVEDVFSTYLYTGNGSTQTITNGINLDEEGGMVWLKSRSLAEANIVVDSARGPTFRIATNSTVAQADNSAMVSAFTSNGFSLGNSNVTNTNASTNVSWTFRKAPKFFDVVTYTGDGVAGRAIPHSLGSVPGSIIVKTTSASDSWAVYHRSLASGYYALLNLTSGSTNNTGVFTTTLPTSTNFIVGNDSASNYSGRTYVAYLFAHDAGGFGDDGEQNVISCGSFTGGADVTVNLGYEPQWVLTKYAGSAQNWTIHDTMRGYTANPTGQATLHPNNSDAEDFGVDAALTSTGFRSINSSTGVTYIYIAIRRGPMKTPESGTEVFFPYAQGGTGSFSVGFPTDLSIMAKRAGNGLNSTVGDRLRGSAPFLSTSLTSAEDVGIDWQFDLQDDFQSTWTAGTVNWNFRRAPSVFDVICYTGNSTARTLTHNLTVAPELIILKSRSSTRNWVVYPNSPSQYLYLNASDQSNAADANWWNSTAPTSSVFSIGAGFQGNETGAAYVAYLFASCPGVSKVGSYTGTAATLQIDCGFTTGARFVLIKRTDDTGDWYVWDSARGIVSGNDPYLLLNDTAAENTSTDYIDPLASGFTVTSSAPAALNASGGSYIFLAIA